MLTHVDIQHIQTLSALNALIIIVGLTGDRRCLSYIGRASHHLRCLRVSCPLDLAIRLNKRAVVGSRDLNNKKNLASLVVDEVSPLKNLCELESIAHYKKLLMVL
jgi:hypothetical protein